jgi:hypothetical protein
MKTILYAGLVVGAIYGTVGMGIPIGTLMAIFLTISLVGALLFDKVLDPAFDSKGVGRTSNPSPIATLMSLFLGVILVTLWLGLVSMTSNQKFNVFNALGIGIDKLAVVGVLLVVFTIAYILVIRNTAGSYIFTAGWIVSAIAVLIDNPAGWVDNILLNIAPVKVIMFGVWALQQIAQLFVQQASQLVNVI